MQEEIAEMLAKSPVADAEEWAIHDYEGFQGIKVNEWHDLEKLAEIASALSDADNPELLAELHNHLGYSDINQAVEYMDYYQGEFDDLESYAMDFIESTGDLDRLPKSLHNQSIMQAFGRDCEMNGDIFTIELDHKIHVFTNR
jgi:antirestriction protein